MSTKSIQRQWISIFATVIGLVILCLAFWYTIDILLLGFAALLLTLLLQGIGAFVARKLHMSYRLSLALILLLAVALATVIIYLAAPYVSLQMNALLVELPKAYASLKTWVIDFFGTSLISEESFSGASLFKNEKVLSQVSSIFSFTVGTISSFIIFLFVGIYVAFDPERYLNGFLALFTPEKKKQVSRLLSHIAHSLRMWIAGKFISMAAIGILTYIGLKLLHIPLAFILALLITLLTFIPYIGAIIASIPAILIALSVGPWKAFYVVILYLGVHAVEGYLITPFVEQKTVSLPPALTVMVQIILALLVGFIGLALASPLTVLAVILIHDIHIKKCLR